MHKLIAFWEGWAAYVLLPALALLVTVDVSLRYVFNAPLAWGTDVLFSAANATRQGALLVQMADGSFVGFLNKFKTQSFKTDAQGRPA